MYAERTRFQIANPLSGNGGVRAAFWGLRATRKQPACFNFVEAALSGSPKGNGLPENVGFADPAYICFNGVKAACVRSVCTLRRNWAFHAGYGLLTVTGGNGSG